jgi:protein-L-isoaspartate(D-aspartate) O-methyltransferase
MNKKELLNNLQQYGFSRDILNAFALVRRENFIDDKYLMYAYEDLPLPLLPGSTISQPFTIAFMLSLLELQNGVKILEIGSGSGYVLALLNEIIDTGEIYGIEINKDVFKNSDQILKDEDRIKVICDDGKNGLLKCAPYDRILISAASQKLPVHLLSQLSEHGIIVASVKSSIVKIKKNGSFSETTEFPGFSFVPLI